ncbi:hypothetical protein RB213_006579 [Colletotrichum asianum]
MTLKSYLPNPSRSAFAILALRASHHQTPAIRQLMLKYITMETSISIEAPVSQLDHLDSATPERNSSS